jgi:undecaprenyl-phosphate 4-deoxy-4-formamido-L-arabinose transferase
MDDKRTDYSVVVPVFNSQSSLQELFDRLLAFFSGKNLSWEVIFVDDFSQDKSPEVLASLKKSHPELITAIRLTRNFGQHNATLCGLNFAKGETVITIDDDLQTPPEEIEKLILCRDTYGYDLVYGIHSRKRHSAARNAGSRTFKASAKALHKSRGEGSSFRLISGDFVKKIIRHTQHFIFLDEVMHWYTDEIGFTEVVHLPRQYDKSGYSFAKLVRLVANLLLYYTMLPLKFLVYGGLIISLITFVYGLFFIFKKLVFDVPLGYTSLIVTILFSTSIILFSLGVLGEYLSRMYQMQNGKPPWSIRKILE